MLRKELLSYYINNDYEVFLFTDGTKIRYKEGEGSLNPQFPESIDCKITNKCIFGCEYCHENSTPDGGEFKEEYIKFFDSLHSGTEIALGGGALTTLGDKLVKVCRQLYNSEINVNITLNEFELNNEIVSEVIPLVCAIGVSYQTGSEKLFELTKKEPTTVVHVINGIFNEEAFDKLKNKRINLLILGYKDFGRGIKRGPNIDKNQKWLYENLEEISKHFRRVSFDNLAIKQLKPERFIDYENYKQRYMGDDGSHTMYVDAVSGTYAINSTAPLSERKPVSDNIDEMFQDIRKRYNGVSNI